MKPKRQNTSIGSEQISEDNELPPLRQPLHMPPEFDPERYPHYSVQSSIYSLLLTALNVSDHYEKYPGAEGRQRSLEELITQYVEICDALKFKT